MATKVISALLGSIPFQTQIQAGKHVFLTDEPESSGGKDSGPNPHDLLLASLGSCTAITLRMYALRKNWPVEKIEVKVSHEEKEESAIIIPEADQKPSEQLDLKITLSGSLSPEQVNRMKEIAQKCPMHKILVAAFEILTEISLETHR